MTRRKNSIAIISALALTNPLCAPAFATPSVPIQPQQAAINAFGQPIPIAAVVPDPSPWSDASWHAKPKDVATGQVDIDNQLTVLSSWGMFSAYKSFFLLLPAAKQIQITLASAGAIAPDGAPHDLQINNLPSLGAINPGTISVKYESALASTPSFNGDPAGGLDRARGNLYFVQVSGFGNYVPANMVDVAEGAFINGLVTRMVLGRYWQMTQNSPMPDGAPPAANPLGSPSAGSNPFEDPANWQQNRGMLSQEADILLNHPIQGDAMLAGWYVGQEAQKNPAIESAIWKLLSYRLTTRTMGESVGYTLTYITGFARNQAIASYAHLIPPGNLSGEQRSEFLLGQLGFDEKSPLHLVAGGVAPFGPAPDDANGYIREFYGDLLKEQYAIATRSDTATTPDNKTALKNYTIFLSGFETGTLKAAGNVYADEFNLAYGLGYEDGFQSGYTKGFSEGYKSGYQQGWSDAAKSIASMKHHGGFFSGVGHFLDQVGDVAKPIATVVTGIVALCA